MYRFCSSFFCLHLLQLQGAMLEVLDVIKGFLINICNDSDNAQLTHAHMYALW